MTLLARSAQLRLIALFALALAGCTTPVLQPSVEVPGQFASTPASDVEPEAVWWQSYGDPVLSGLIQRAALENRDVKIAAQRVRAARAGETISRSRLLPSIGAYRRRLRSQHKARLLRQAVQSRYQEWRRRHRRLVGNRRRRRFESGCVGRSR